MEITTTKCKRCGGLYLSTPGDGGMCDFCLEVKPKPYHATWSYIPDPLYEMICPHCQARILMSKPSTMDKLINWAKRIKR